MPPLLPDEATKAQETFRLGDRFYVEEHGLVLGGLMKFFPIKGGINPGTDLNTIGGAGIYNLSGEYTNAPFSQSWGNLIVLSDGSKTQIVTEYTGSTFSIFTRGDNSREWYKVNLTKDI